VVLLFRLFIFLSKSASWELVFCLLNALLFDSLQVHLKHKLATATVSVADVKIAVEDISQPLANVQSYSIRRRIGCQILRRAALEVRLKEVGTVQVV
jgi:hypothetical protein